jgi:8-oxo-dGTP diphosphatase
MGEHPVTVVVDVANVMGSRPDGWWRDRAGAAVRLHADLVRLAASGRAMPPGETDPPDFVMVLEGAAKAAAARISAASASASAGEASAAPTSEAPAGDVRVVQARGSGDDTIVEVVRDLAGRRIVVTADRELRERSVAAGATILGPGWLLGLLRPLAPGAPWYRATRPVQPGGPLSLSPPAHWGAGASSVAAIKPHSPALVT